MPKMLDQHVTPVGMPLGIEEMEKQIWLALYVTAQKLLATGECASAEAATQNVTQQWGKLKGKDSREFRFALRWSKSVTACLKMKQDFRSSDGHYLEAGHS